MKKEKLNKCLIIIGLVFLLATGIYIARYCIYRNAFYDCCSEGELERAGKIAAKLHNDKIWEDFNLLYAKELEKTDICKAIETYYRVGTEEAKARAAELSKYQKLGGVFVDDENNSETVKIAVRDGELYYGVENHYAKLGEDIQYTTEVHYTTTIELSQDFQELYENVTYKNGSSCVSEDLRYISVNSPQFLDESYLEKGHEYYDNQIKKSSGYNPKLDYTQCYAAGCDGKPMDGHWYCRVHKCIADRCNMKKSTGSSYCTKHSQQYEKKGQSTNKSAGSEYDPYDVKDYDSADAFADDKYEEFYDYEDYYDDEDEAYDDAVDYWSDSH